MVDLTMAPVANYTPPQAPTGAANPLGMAGTIMQMQQMQNQNKLFQQEFQAKQAIGQIMSTAPDIDTGLRQVSQSPYAAFAGPAVAAYRSAEQMQSAIALQKAQTQGALMEQYQKGAAGVSQALLPAMADPAAMIDKQMAQAASIYPKEMQPQIKSYLDSVKKATMAGVDPKDPGAKDKMRANLAAQLTGVVPMEQLYGTTLSTDEGTGTRISRVPPAWNPDQTPQTLAVVPKGQLGGVNEETGLVRRSLSPEQLANPTGTSLPMMAASAAPGANALGVPGPSATASASGAGPAAPAATAATAAPAPTSPYSFAGGSMTPDMIQPSVTGTGLNAYSGQVVPAPTKAQKDQEQKLSDDYTGPGAQKAEAARQALSQLTIAKSDIDQMVKDGIKPGTGTPMLVEMIKAGNRFLQLTDPSGKSSLPETASAEDAMKQLGRLSLSSSKTLINNPQIAAESLQKAIEANPSLSNSELGLKLVLSGVQSDLQRELDKRQFLTTWKNDPRNQGLLGNAEETFNKQFPPEKYADAVLKQHGMIMKNGELRFGSPDALVQAVRDGTLTPEQAKAIRARQFPSGQ